MRSYCFSDKLSNWFQNFLSDRTQAVRVNNSLSDLTNVLSGCPQGTSSAQFYSQSSLTTSLIFNCDQGKIKLFADDLKIFFPLRNINDHINLQDCLNHINDWSILRQLPISLTKCMHLHIGPNLPAYFYKLGSILIQSVSEVKDLGVIIDNKLSFSNHCPQICTKARQRLGLIFKTFINRDPVSLCKAYVTYVRPLLEYYTSICNPHLHKYINLIESV